MQAYLIVAQVPAIFARGLAAAAKRSPLAQQSTAALRAVREKASGAKEPFIAELIRMSEIQGLEIEAMAAASKNDFDEAIKIMHKATALEQATPPPPGPPPVIKPAHELFGETLLRAGRRKEAVEPLATSLSRHPNRARSLLGAARAAAKSGDTRGAANFYALFARQWQQADEQLPELREAQDYSKQAGAR
jgi:hypothetical protein